MTLSENTSITSGNASGGFEARIDTVTRRLHVRLWGLWSLEVAKSFVAAVDKLGRELGQTPWTSLVDARKFSVQDPLLEAHREESLKLAARLGCRKMATLVESSVYALQFKRLASKGHVVNQTFPDLAAARAWLAAEDRPSPTETRGR